MKKRETLIWSVALSIIAAMWFLHAFVRPEFARYRSPWRS